MATVPATPFHRSDFAFRFRAGPRVRGFDSVIAEVPSDAFAQAGLGRCATSESEAIREREQKPLATVGEQRISGQFRRNPRTRGPAPIDAAPIDAANEEETIEEVKVEARRDPSKCFAATAAAGSSGTQIVIAYTDANSSTPIPFASHAFVIAYDLSSGRAAATRGGPGSGPGGGADVRAGQIVGVTGPLNSGFPDQPGQVTAYQPVGGIALSLSQVAARMANFSQVTTANNLAYLPTLNSNSYAFTFVESLGFRRPEPIVPWAPGWANGSVSTNLDCATP